MSVRIFTLIMNKIFLWAQREWGKWLLPQIGFANHHHHMCVSNPTRSGCILTKYMHLPGKRLHREELCNIISVDNEKFWLQVNGQAYHHTCRSLKNKWLQEDLPWTVGIFPIFIALTLQGIIQRYLRQLTIIFRSWCPTWTHLKLTHQLHASKLDQ